MDMHVAMRAPPLKPKRVNDAKSFIEQFGVDREESDADILRGHRSSDGQPMVKVGGFGKYTTSYAVDLAAGKPYVRKRDRVPFDEFGGNEGVQHLPGFPRSDFVGQPNVQTLFG